jgi:hypothetical protein
VDRDRLVTLFRRWSEFEAVANLSPLYALLGNAVADDPELLDLANECLPTQPPPNIFFAAVHALLAEDRAEPLAGYYATVGGTLPAEPRAAGLFREFCLRRRDDLLPLIRSRLTQTNEVRRSALLLPAFAAVAAHAGKMLALIEIGPSAGLNLNFDRYRYRYGTTEIGDPRSPLLLECEPRGPEPLVKVPAVDWRCGIDLSPLDVGNPADVAWLRALLWPEHTDRLALLESAIVIAKEHPPVLFDGDLFERLRSLVSSVADHSVPCLFATFVLNQFSPEMLSELRALLRELSEGRALYFVVMGFTEFIEPGAQLDGATKVWILRLRNGHGECSLSSIANPHGRWIEWKPARPWKPWSTSV